MPVDLWSFTLDFYARPGVEQACLQLQAQGADVCVVLCGVWLGWRAVPCTDVRVVALDQAAGPWQVQVVGPLRALRTQWRQAATGDSALATLREQVKALELQAERTLLERLQALAGDWPQGQVQDVQGWLDALAGQQDRAARQVLCDAARTVNA
ncbi:TIGR02444 family protein [Pseudomonas syringae]|nr:TIGR02444 family protein [Pseudomonas syringae]MBD8577049.1 TIGR02444 family protein [Pseudomonas syringae]MBD8788342.1 TIGR02444 family protein [Pseudomonas syringae]MBD8799458.1 TIGR02444 family protein [Pseudomonas syringae]MBD8814674.1 TIGR02444 family protein [Pseudomonas syringae]